MSVNHLRAQFLKGTVLLLAILFASVTNVAAQNAKVVKGRITDPDGMRYRYVMSQAQMSCGVPYTMIWDMAGCGSSWNMYGLKSTQQMLIVAECEIRKGNFDEAMGYLDDIRRGRINPETYAPLKGSVNTKEAAIAALKQTALGENVYSIYNFIERKRWNQLDDMKETLKKNILGNEFTLAPDSKLWIFPFPGNAVDNNPNLKQNSYDEDAAE